MTETTTETLYCYVHPTRETALRCNNCNRPICAACAVRTPIGYRCRECVKGQQKAFDTSEWYDYLTGFIVAALDFPGGIVSGYIHWAYWFLRMVPDRGGRADRAVLPSPRVCVWSRANAARVHYSLQWW